MKKIRLLTPLIGLGAIATSTIGLVSCGNTKFYLDTIFEYVLEGHKFNAITTQNPISTSNKKISIEIDTSFLPKTNNEGKEEKYDASFWITNQIAESEDQDYIAFAEVAIYWDGKTLEKVDTVGDLIKPNQYTIGPETQSYRIYISKGTLEASPKLTIDLEIKKTFEKYYPIFWESKEI